MAFRSILMGVVTLAVAGVAGAQAQSPFPPVGQQPQASPFPPVGQQPQASPFPPIGGQQSSPIPSGPAVPPFGQQQKPPCYDEFTAMSGEAEKRFTVVQAGITKHASAAEMCTLLTKFGQSQATMVKFVQQNIIKCGFPPTMLEGLKASSARAEGYRKQACTAAAGPPRPAEPTLSDAFSPPPVGKDNTKTGGGTLDSLYGNPLAR